MAVVESDQVQHRAHLLLVLNVHGWLQGSAGGTNTAGPDLNTGAVNQDREAYALAAGFALGLINIGRGHASSGVSAANGGIVETLKRLILGGAWGVCLSDVHGYEHRYSA